MNEVEKNEVDCSIVIVNWNSTDYLVECIKSILQMTKCSYEIIVIDNNSSPEERAKLLEMDNIRLLLNENNMGFAAANNQGIRQAKGKCVLLLNPDTKLVNNAIDRMLAFLNSHEAIYAIGPKLYRSCKFDYHPSVKSFDSPMYNLFFLIPGSLYLKNFYQFFLSKAKRPKKVNCLIGAAILLRRSVFDKVGLLDEQFFLYSEEVDLFFRMKQAGLKTVYYPEAKVIHYGGKSQQKSTGVKMNYLWTSKIRYFEKYHGKLNVTINLYLIYLLLKTKLILFKKNELAQLCGLIEMKLNKKLDKYGI